MIAIEDIERAGNHLLLEQTAALHEYLQEKILRSAIIVGAGYIGMEMIAQTR